MRQGLKLLVSYIEELKAKVHIVVYTKEREEDYESVSFWNHVTFQNEYNSLPLTKFDEELEDIFWYWHISINENYPYEEEDVRDDRSKL